MAEKRMGLVLPSPNIHMEPQFYALGLPEVSFFTTRVMLKETTEEALVQMEQDLDYASRMLATIHPDVVAYCCTSGSFIRGDAFDNQIAKTIEKNCGCPGVTTSSAMGEAMGALGIRRVALITPYTDDINVQEKKYIEGKGIQVVASFGFQKVANEPLVALTRQEWIDASLETDTPEADALFLSCTNTKAMPAAEELEEKLGKPVLTSNSVTLWKMLRTVGYDRPVAGCGMLLSQYLNK